MNSNPFFTILSALNHPFLIVETQRGICRLLPCEDPADLEQEREKLAARYPGACCIRSSEDLLMEWKKRTPTLPVLDLHEGTAFQQKVWDALKDIPFGETRTYSDIAKTIGQPEAVRAVGQACGANPVALLIPCHRVVRRDGSLGGYRWGVKMKKALLDLENRSAFHVEHSPKLPVP